MKNRLFAPIKFVSIGLLIAGIVSAAVAYSLKQANGNNRRPATGFTIVTKETAVFTGEPDSPEPGYIITTRYQRSDGTWKRVKVFYRADGKIQNEDVGFGIPGQGVYQLDKERVKLNFISGMPSKEQAGYAEITDGRNHPNFLKHEVVQGYQTYVLHFTDQEGGYTDVYFAPELDNYPIKQVKVGTGGTAVTEPIQIQIGDPDDNVFRHFPKWLVNFDRFKEKIQALEDEGKHDSAEGFRQELQKQLAKQGSNQ